MSFSGGVGSGSLPTANVGKYEGSIINSKKIYAVCQVEREAIKASEQSEGAFVKAMAETVKKTLESFMRNMSRQLFADGSGILAKGDGVLSVYGAGSVADPYVLSIAAANFFDANLEERDLVNVVTGLSALNLAGAAELTSLEILSVDVNKFTVSLVGTSVRLAALVAAGTTYTASTVAQVGTVITGAATTFVIGMIGGTIVYYDAATPTPNVIGTSVITGFTSTTVIAAATSQTITPATYKIVYGANKLAATDGFAMQNSYLNDMTGLRGIATQSALGTGSIYNVPVQRRWSMQTYAAGGNAITVDLINQEMLKIERKSGKVPNLIVCGFKQYQKMLDLHKDLKRYPVSPKDSKFAAQFSFDGLQFMSTAGIVPVVYDRFVHDDEIWLLNDNYITITMRPGGVQWFEEDGTVFLRDTGSDSYSARYGGYLENYCIPTFQGIITGLAV
jgi:hypothetical protein